MLLRCFRVHFLHNYFKAYIIHFNDNRQKSTKFNFRFFIQYLSGLKKGILLGLLRSNIAHLWWVVMLKTIQLKS